MNTPRRIAVVASVLGLALALAGCGSTPPADPTGSASPGSVAAGSPTPAGTAAGATGGTAGGGSGAGGATQPPTPPPPGSPPECTELAAAAGLHGIAESMDKLAEPSTAAAGATDLKADAEQLRKIAAHTSSATLKSRLIELATSFDAVAATGIGNAGALMGMASALRNVEESVADICHIAIG